MFKSMKNVRHHRLAVSLLGLAAFVAAVGFGVAQSTVVTQAEWAVYLVQALELDWHLPPSPKSNDYISRLRWTTGIEFGAIQMLPGSSSSVRVAREGDSGWVTAEAPMAEALYNVTTLRPGDYDFRVKLAGGGAMVKVGSSVFEAYQPDEQFRWVDLNRVSLDAGAHSVSLLLDEGTRAEMLGVTPPCLVSVEPPGGWQPLLPLTYRELAVTLAKVLELEHGLPTIGMETVIKGEDFERILELPAEEAADDSGRDPFWLSSYNSILTARAHFTLPESGLYSLEARYVSPNAVRWNVDGCLRAVSCPVPGGAGMIGSNILALQLEAGEYDLVLTLPPNASLDQVVIRRKDDSIEEYLGVVADEGFRLGSADELVRRREAINAVRRLRSLFRDWRETRCADTLLSLEQLGALIQAASSAAAAGQAVTGAGRALESLLPDITRGTDPTFGSQGPLIPTDPGTPPPASPITP